MSPPQLASYFLGAVGRSGGYVVTDLSNYDRQSWGPIGFSGFTLFTTPRSAGSSMCVVDAAEINFRVPGPFKNSDPLRPIDKVVIESRYAVLRQLTLQDQGWAEMDRECAKLSPVAGSEGPTFFIIFPDTSSDAEFAVRAAAKAFAKANMPGASIGCDTRAKPTTICADPAGIVRRLPLQRIARADIRACPDLSGHRCVFLIWNKGGIEQVPVSLAIRTDAADPAAREFNVLALDLAAVYTVDY